MPGEANSSAAAVTAELLEPLRQSLSTSAQVLLPSDPTFLSTIESWNHDFHTATPSAAVLPTCTADVAAAIKFFRAHSLPFTVGCGLHSRWSRRDGHVLLYLGLMRKVAIDVAAKVARVQGGARNADIDEAGGACRPTLHVVAGTNPDTGLGGLVLGGGIGFLSRRQGMTIDNLLEVELVTAEGAVVRANEAENADLFWAVRGAGFNFGVVTEFVLRVHDDVGHQARVLSADDEALATKHGVPAQEAMLGHVLHGVMPYPRAEYLRIAGVLQERYVAPGAAGPLVDRDLVLGLVAANTPMGAAALVVFVYVGDAYAGYRALDALLALLGAPLAPVPAVVKLGTYVQLQHMFDMVAPPGYYYERTYWAPQLDAATAGDFLACHEAVDRHPGCGRSAMIALILGGGAMHDNEGRGAFSAEQRRGVVMVGTSGHWEPSEGGGEDNRKHAVAWVTETREVVLPHCSSIYTNSVNGQSGQKATFGPSLDRLRQIKQQWDPLNVFCNNQNVVPAGKDEQSSATAHLDLN